MPYKGKHLKMASISDIHLGHSNTPTVDVIARLRNAFRDCDETGELDIIWLAGDIFDKLLFFPDNNVHELQIWINDFLRMCSKRNIAVRVLEGTPSHDRGQGKHFVTINTLGGHNVDLKYVDTLSIEYVTALDINVLYVPDEWDHDPNVTWESVCGLLQQHGLDKVDYAIMHGQFEYHLPEHLKLPAHESKRYLSIVKRYIFIGHIHLTSIVDRILTAGSFDRICHNEEGPKGHFRVQVSDDGKNDKITFVENKQATKYITINCMEVSIEGVWERLADYKDYPANSHFRIECSKDSEIRQSMTEVKNRYPLFQWKLKITAQETDGQGASTGLVDKFVATEISPTNICALVHDKLNTQGLDGIVLQRVMVLLDKVI